MSATNIIPQPKTNGKNPQPNVKELNRGGWLTHQEIKTFLQEFHAKQERSRQNREAAKRIALTVIEAAIRGQPVEDYSPEQLWFAKRWIEAAQ